MTELVASGTVRVRSLVSGDEWDEIVEIFTRDVEDSDVTVEDVARRVARNQAPEQVETLEVDVS